MTIPARFSGVCHRCEGTWRPGDLIRTDTTEGLPEWEHAACPVPLSDYEHHVPVCPSCWLSHAGECDR